MHGHSWPYSGLTKPSQDVTVFGDDSEGSTTGSDCEPNQEYEHSQPRTIQHPANKICKEQKYTEKLTDKLRASDKQPRSEDDISPHYTLPQNHPRKK
jgi:hypothetical protein